MPTPEEARTLRLGSGAPVLTIVRRMTSLGRVVEVKNPFPWVVNVANPLQLTNTSVKSVP